MNYTHAVCTMSARPLSPLPAFFLCVPASLRSKTCSGKPCGIPQMLALQYNTPSAGRLCHPWDFCNFLEAKLGAWQAGRLRYVEPELRAAEQAGRLRYVEPELRAAEQAGRLRYIETELRAAEQAGRLLCFSEPWNRILSIPVRKFSSVWTADGWFADYLPSCCSEVSAAPDQWDPACSARKSSSVMRASSICPACSMQRAIARMAGDSR